MYGAVNQDTARHLGQQATMPDLRTEAFLNQFHDEHFYGPAWKPDKTCRAFDLTNIDNAPDIPRPKMSRVQQRPPKGPNAYLDGTIKLPTASYMAYGGYAAMYPDDFDCANNAPNESGAPLIDKTTIEIEVYIAQAGMQDGPFPSPMGVEALAALLILQAPAAIHNALDSRTVVRIMMQIIARMHRQYQKPWALRLHGDIFQAVQKSITLRGPLSQIFTWTKGHAIDKDVQEGRSTEKGKKCNDMIYEYVTYGSVNIYRFQK